MWFIASKVSQFGIHVSQPKWKLRGQAGRLPPDLFSVSILFAALRKRLRDLGWGFPDPQLFAESPQILSFDSSGKWERSMGS